MTPETPHPPDLVDLATGDATVKVDQWTIDNSEIALEELLRSASPSAPWTDGLRSTRMFVATGPSETAGILSGTSRDSESEVRRAIRVSHWDNPGETPSHPLAPLDNDLTEARATSSASALESRSYGWYRTHRSASLDQPTFFAIVTITFDGPDQDRLRRWIDALLEAIHAEPEPIPGLAVAHLLTSSDGTQVLNLAGWTSEDEYDRTLEHGPDGIAQTELPQWQHLIEAPGVVENTVTRCSLRSTDARPN